MNGVYWVLNKASLNKVGFYKSSFGVCNSFPHHDNSAGIIGIGEGIRAGEEGEEVSLIGDLAWEPKGPIKCGLPPRENTFLDMGTT